jgi:hypothetical protein
MPLESIGGKERCRREECPEFLGCDKEGERDCFACDGRHRCKYVHMVALHDKNAVTAHGYCSRKCIVSEYLNVCTEGDIEEILNNFSEKEFREMISLMQAVGKIVELVPKSAPEASALKKKLLRRKKDV